MEPPQYKPITTLGKLGGSIFLDPLGGLGIPLNDILVIQLLPSTGVYLGGGAAGAWCPQSSRTFARTRCFSVALILEILHDPKYLIP